MSLSLHEMSVAVLARGLQNLSHILDKGAAHAAANGVSPETLIQSRLHSDMRPLASQIQFASDTSKGAAARLAGVEAPSFPDTETTFEELQARITKTLDFLATVTPEKLEGGEDRAIELRVGPERVFHFTGRSYLTTFVLPNFFFHVTTAYGILRAAGVDLGKGDYLGRLQ